MDAMSNVPKRNVLAEHLKEVIDVLEQKVCVIGWLILLMREGLIESMFRRETKLPLFTNVSSSRISRLQSRLCMAGLQQRGLEFVDFL